MAKCCEICGKAPKKSAKRTFSNIQVVSTQEPNLQSVKAVVNGTRKTVNVCTRCLRSGKVTRAM